MKILVFLSALLFAAMASGADAEERRITVSATGTAEAAPDMAVITVGVTNQDRQASVAMRATSDAVGKILARLADMGTDPRDVQTRDLSLSPVWSGRNASSGPAPQITGFVASNRVVLRVRNLDELGQVMDAVIQDGANDFGGLSFSVQDPAPLEVSARENAVTAAMAKATQLAQAAGVTLGPVLTISDQGGGARPMPQMREMSLSDAGGVPVAGGEISVAVTVLMEFAITD